MLISIDFIKELRGFKILSEDEDSFYIFIGSGTRNTGGYDIEAFKVEEIKDIVKITIKETIQDNDQMVTEALTYQYIVILISKYIQNNFEVISTLGEIFEDINDEGREGIEKPVKYDIIGDIIDLSSNDKNAFLMVEGEKNVHFEYGKASVRVDDKTMVFINDNSANKAQLEKGMFARIMFEGPVMESYPVQAYAKTVYAYKQGSTNESNTKEIKEETHKVTISKLEDYEGSIILSTENKLRMKVDENTKLSLGDLELKENLIVWVIISNDPSKADPTDYYAVSIYIE